MSDAARNASALDKLVKEYRSSRAQIIKIIILALISGGVALIFFTAAVLDNSNGLAGKIGFSVGGALFSLPVIAGIYMLLTRRGSSVSLYENGLIYRRGGKEFVTSWDEIASSTQETVCRVVKKDGVVIEFGLNIKDADEVVQKIQDETLSRMLLQVKAAILQGSSVQFQGLKPFAKVPLGKAVDTFARAFSGFTVNANGIAMIDGGNRIAWKDVTDCGIAEEIMGMGAGRTPIDVFYIADENQSFRTRLGLLSNAHYCWLFALR